MRLLLKWFGSLHVSLGHKVRSRDEALPNADALLELQEAEEEEGNHGKAGANLHRGSPRPASGHKGGGNGHEGKEEQKEFTQKGTLCGVTPLDATRRDAPAWVESGWRQAVVRGDQHSPLFPYAPRLAVRACLAHLACTWP